MVAGYNSSSNLVFTKSIFAITLSIYVHITKKTFYIIVIHCTKKAHKGFEHLKLTTMRLYNDNLTYSKIVYRY